MTRPPARPRALEIFPPEVDKSGERQALLANRRFRPSAGKLRFEAIQEARELVFELDDAFLLGMDDALEVFVLLDYRAAAVAGQVGPAE